MFCLGVCVFVHAGLRVYVCVREREKERAYCKPRLRVREKSGIKFVREKEQGTKLDLN